MEVLLLFVGFAGIVAASTIGGGAFLIHKYVNRSKKSWEQPPGPVVPERPNSSADFE